MKRFTPTLFAWMVILSLIFVLNPALAKQKIILDQSKSNQLELQSASYEKLSFVNTLSVLRHQDVDTEEGVFTRLFISGYGKNLQTGHPLLPLKREMIEIPVNANPRVLINSYETTEINLSDYGISNKLFPSQPEQFKNDNDPEFHYDQQAYQINGYGEKKLVTVDVLGFMRGTGMGRVNVAPIKYNPVSNTLLIYTKIDFEIFFDDADIPQTLELKKKYGSPYFASINQKLVNYQPGSSRENFHKYPVKYVIIADPMFESQLQPFIQWKTQKGFIVVEAYTDDPEVGNTTTEIKSYIQGLYEAGTPEDPAPTFVLFVGDIQQIPAWNGTTGGHATDLYYCEYTGDYFPEVYYGRFSAQNTNQLQPQIDKTLDYEKYMMVDPSYLDTVLMVAGMDGYHGNDWGNGQVNYGTINYFNAAHDLYAHTYLYPESGSHSADIIQNVSDGVAYGNYTAHCGPSGWGDPSFTTSDVSGLQNEGQYGLLVGNCCQSNSYDVNECFGEALLRAENKGALAYIGGSNNTMWDPDYYWGVGVGEISENPPAYDETTLGAYDRTFHDHGELFAEWYVSADEMIYAGNLAVTEGTPNQAEYYWEIYCLMGDPSLMVFFSLPETLDATYPAMIPLGTNTVTVTTEPYGYIGISKDGVLHGSALADSLGDAEVEIEPFGEPGTVDIVVTLQNFQPHMGTSTAASPDGPYIVMTGYEIDDRYGDSDSLADNGEKVMLNVSLTNLGNGDAANVNASISTLDTNVILQQNDYEWGVIASGDTVTIDSAFIFDVEEFIDDQHKVKFDILIEGEERETWESDFTITLNAPVLTLGNIEIDDEDGGNGNGLLDPGETADVIITNLNNGHQSIYGLIGILSTTDPDITINEAGVSIDSLAPGQEVEAILNITVSGSAEVGSVADLSYTLESEPYAAEDTFLLSIGLIMEDYESGDFGNFPWNLTGDADWTICEDDPWQGVYCSQSGEITHDQSTMMFMEYEVASDDSISFYKKVSCEDDPYSDNYDLLAFYIDGQEMGRWDGEIDWSKEVFEVEEGIHTFKWEYRKDGYLSEGADCAWVDYIVFPPSPGWVGTEEMTGVNALDVKLYPNPAKEQFNILLKGQTYDVSIRLFNSVGQLTATIEEHKVFAGGLHEYQMSTSGLQDGIYYCVIQTAGEKITKKIIITK
ncbi:MAG: T9SS type A sorting domain-containing protein [Bacteroidales bacterium]|nr:T9SS type A sorting domain-containing protein [Bacteroidales bacterium]MCF8350371.1 T9SS type A sorting domain-containing protein [Bacteroidales bacterium]MCF8376256.1 T9SS type A sorting domain-containing protein [Bacteroidales bacterium]MCF8401187.1 T9SS type A sorting domain-containing protein [Bacteroidales bacterium]